MGLSDVLPPGPVALDTLAFIYYIEEHPTYAGVLEPLFAEADAGRRILVTSVLTLLEVLVVPYRVGDVVLAERYEAVLTRGRGLRLADIDRPALKLAARLRAVLGARTPDALQLAAALQHRCAAFLTNDARLPEPSGLRVLQLRDLVAAA